jgi:hypothetical protein
MYLVFSTFTSRPTYLPAPDRASVSSCITFQITPIRNENKNSSPSLIPFGVNLHFLHSHKKITRSIKDKCTKQLQLKDHLGVTDEKLGLIVSGWCDGGSYFSRNHE